MSILNITRVIADQELLANDCHLVWNCYNLYRDGDDNDYYDDDCYDDDDYYDDDCDDDDDYNLWWKQRRYGRHGEKHIIAVFQQLGPAFSENIFTIYF